MAIESIAKTLGTGSGIDVSALVEQLVSVSFENRNAALTAKSDKLTAQVSKASELKSTISDFSSALASLTANGALSAQPSSSNSGVVNVSRLAGANLNGLNANLEVRQLAQGQVASTNAFSGGDTTVIGTGTLTLTFGTATVSGTSMSGFTPGAATPISIEIDSTHETLDGIADAINAANAGVTASILNDSTGARLVVKGATGASQAFQLQGSGGLSVLDIGPGATGSQINTTAQNSIVAIDGVETNAPTNTLYGLIEGVKIDLVSASPGTKVVIGASMPTTAITQSVTNFVDTYNEVYRLVQDAVNPIDGPLRNDAAAKDLLRQLKTLTLTVLAPDAASGAPGTLADIGVGTTREGTLSLNATRLATVLVTYPKEIEAMFAQGAGLTKALGNIAARATSTETGLGASESNYTNAKSKLSEEQDDIAAATEKLRSRMTQQFAAMDAKVAAYKSTMSFLENQIKAWNSDS